MTYSSRELREQRVVSDDVLRWRAWRRSMRLTIPEAAAMAEVDARYLQRIETGRVQPGKRYPWSKLVALMERWDESLRPVKPHRARARRR